MTTRRTILVIDDDPAMRDSLAFLLDVNGFSVTTHETAADFLDHFGRSNVDCVVSDIRMPGISGIEVARSLSELSPRTQVVFVTAYDQYAIDAFEQGAMDYLLKPVSDERLLATRERILSRLPSTRQDDAVLERLCIVGPGHRRGHVPAAQRPCRCGHRRWLRGLAGGRSDPRLAGHGCAGQTRSQPPRTKLPALRFEAWRPGAG